MKIFTAYFLFTISCFQFLTTFAQDPVLVSDFNVGTDDSFNEFNFEGIEFDNKLIFPIMNTEVGEELAVLNDGELSLLMDINEGTESSSPTEFVLFNDRVFFSAYSATEGGGIWSTDGTEANTVQVAMLGNTPDIKPRGLMVAKSGWLYYTYDNELYRNNGVENDFIASDISFRESFNQASGNYTTYKDEIAFIQQEEVSFLSDFINVYTVENGDLVLLATSTETSGFARLFGLNEINDGLIFGSEDQAEETTNGTFFYSNATNELTMINVGGEFPRRVENLNSESVFAWVANDGFYAMNGIQDEEQLLVSNDDISMNAGSTFENGIYQDKIVFFYDEGTFGSNFIAISDGTNSGTSILTETTDRFPSNVLIKDNYAFLASGTSNGNDPEFYAVNMTNETVVNFYNSSERSSVYMIGELENKLYFAGNFDNTIGLELYYLELDFITSNKTVAKLDAEIKIFNDSYTVQMDDQLSLQTEIYTLDGRLLKSENIFSNSSIRLPAYNGALIITARHGEKHISKKALIISSK